MPPEPLRALLASASVEMGCEEVPLLAAAAKRLRPGTDIFITLPPDGRWEDLLRAAQAVHESGLNPVPHVPARKITGPAQLAGLAAQLAGPAGVTKLLLLAGDVAQPAGEYDSTLPVLESGLFPAHGITSICVAGHPEGHAHMSPATQAGFEQRKVELAHRQGLQLTFVTQLCFEAGPLLAFERQLRTRGITTPVRAGIPGPASLATLRQFAQIYGSGPSARVLEDADAGTGTSTPPQALRTPDGIAGELAGACARGEAQLQALHLFSFGGFLDACDWIARSSQPV